MKQVSNRPPADFGIAERMELALLWSTTTRWNSKIVCPAPTRTLGIQQLMKWRGFKKNLKFTTWTTWTTGLLSLAPHHKESLPQLYLILYWTSNWKRQTIRTCSGHWTHRQSSNCSCSALWILLFSLIVLLFVNPLALSALDFPEQDGKYW